MDAKHELLSELSRITQGLGTVPSRRQWKEHAKLSSERVDKYFGTWSIFLQAAGYDVNEARKERKAKIDGLFRPDIDEFLEAQSREATTHNLGFSISDLGAALPDTHFPFHDKKTIEAFIKRCKRDQPKWIAQLGDLHDQFASSRFPSSRLTLNPAQEIQTAHKLAAAMWKDLREACPKAALIQILGNHDIRPLKRVLEAAPELEVFIDLERFYRFDGVKVYMETRDILLIHKELELTHGHWSQPGQYAKARGRSIIHGHTHKLSMRGVTNLEGKQFFEVSAGFAGAYSAKVQGYHPKKEYDAQHGFVLTRDGEITLIAT